MKIDPSSAGQCSRAVRSTITLPGNSSFTINQVYPNNLKIWPMDGIESCRKSTTAGFVNDYVLSNTGSFTIVDFRRFEPVPWPNFEVVWVYSKFCVSDGRSSPVMLCVCCCFRGFSHSPKVLGKSPASQRRQYPQPNGS